MPAILFVSVKGLVPVDDSSVFKNHISFSRSWLSFGEPLVLPSLTFAAPNEGSKLHNGFCPVTVNTVEYVSVSGRFR